MKYFYYFFGCLATVTGLMFIYNFLSVIPFRTNFLLISIPLLFFGFFYFYVALMGKIDKWSNLSLLAFVSTIIFALLSYIYEDHRSANSWVDLTDIILLLMIMVGVVLTIAAALIHVLKNKSVARNDS